MTPDDWWDRHPEDGATGAVAVALLIASLIAFVFGCGVGAVFL